LHHYSCFLHHHSQNWGQGLKVRVPTMALVNTMGTASTLEQKTCCLVVTVNLLCNTRMQVRLNILCFG
jgi:hypothetical protein